MGTHYNRLVEGVLTSNHNLCFEQEYEKYQIFFFWFFFFFFFFFLVVKFSIYLNRHVFVMKRKSKNLPKCIQTPYCAILSGSYCSFTYLMSAVQCTDWQCIPCTECTSALGLLYLQEPLGCADNKGVQPQCQSGHLLLIYWTIDLLEQFFSTASALIDSVHVRLIWVIDLLQTLKTSSPDAAHVPFGVLSLRKHAYSNI